MSEETTAHNEGVFLADCLLQDHWCVCFWGCWVGCLVGCLVGCFLFRCYFRKDQTKNNSSSFLSQKRFPSHDPELCSKHSCQPRMPFCGYIHSSELVYGCVCTNTPLCHTHTYTCARALINGFVPENSAQST